MDGIGFWFSYVTLWVLVVCLAGSLALLLRQEGRRVLIARRGREDQGPSIGTYFDYRRFRRLVADEHVIDSMTSQSRHLAIVLFTDPHCSPCRNAIAVVTQFVAMHSESVKAVIVVRGVADSFSTDVTVEGTGIVFVEDIDGSATNNLHVATTPFAIAVDVYGRVANRTNGISPAILEAWLGSAGTADSMPSEEPGVHVRSA